TEYYCADLAFVPSGNVQDTDHQLLYVANRWRHSVLKYQVDVVRDPLSNRPADVVQSPKTEILGAGNNPWPLAAAEQQNAIFVASNKGGELARVNVRTGLVERRISINARSADVVNIQDLLYVPTTMPDRGFLAQDDSPPLQVVTPPLTLTGVDGKPPLAHP